ncbi:MAG TPA: protein kinase, partial [Planctomycetota bacterium]|nr:protein kinase [Planctomycetota bacterium]
IVHRDLKPSNILLAKSGEPKVADFGLAHLVDSSEGLTRTGSSLGTPLYMSPEQVEGRSQEISPRTDVYSLGSILYEILTGRPPHGGETMMEIYAKIVRDDPVPPKRVDGTVAEDLETIALKALEKDPGRRYPSAQAFAEDLRRHLDGEPIEARPPSLAYRAVRKLKKHPAATSLTLAVLTAVLSAAGIWRSGLSERDRRLTLLRDNARLSLDAALKLRRAGANAAMRGFLPALEAAYRQALESAPDQPEVEYLMGRMHRALLENDQALQFQERALRKEPEYAPALYERAVLVASRFGTGLSRALAAARRLPPGPVTPQASRDVPLPDPQSVEGSRSELTAFRDSILRDCTALERILARGPARGGPISEAHILTVKGLLAYHRKQFAESRTLLDQAIRIDPSLEEAWSALCATSDKQAFLRAETVADADLAIRIYEESEENYKKALANDQGYVPHWLGLAELRRLRGLFLMRRGRDAMPAFQEAEGDLSRALALGGDDPVVRLLRANVRHIQGVFRIDRREDPTKELDGADEDADAGIAREGDRATPWIVKGHIHSNRARWKRIRGEDPLAQYASAEESFRKALERDPLETQAKQSLGWITMVRADYRGSRGQDPFPDFAESENILNELIQEARHEMTSWDRRAQLFHLRGSYRMSRNEDAVGDFTRADGDYAEALRLSPAHPSLKLEQGIVRSKLARLLEQRGELPEARRLYAGAVEDFQQAFELNGSLEKLHGQQLQEARQRLAALPSGK